MMANYTTFKKYTDVAEAKNLQKYLLENGIECLFIDNSPRLGSSFSGELLKEYEIQLKKQDFEKAEILLEQQAENMIKDLPEDYYMLTFTNDELYDVVLKHDEWSEFDYVLARKLLAERGKAIDDSLIKSLRKQRISDLAQPEKDQKAWVVFGYISALLGGFLGIITGYVLLTVKKTLPNGERVYTYAAADRAHGRIILILGIAVLAISIVLRIVE
ncbi:hypothetical protein GR160_14500 [Flavobacterium sp. Sd200]|uniref:hypothetical protein n=1 Tax=Flavobacterium sp. Sd200 TaxID=2692211 RepID=UPI001368691B|nr:hypothetical protein [Flavobacterium sp. Sd200]MXN92436.1 hypothetical protein [Flavobacterium sp. Sd200]